MENPENTFPAPLELPQKSSETRKIFSDPSSMYGRYFVSHVVYIEA